MATVDIGTVKDRSVLAITHLEDDIVNLDHMTVWTGNHQDPVDLQDVEDTIHQQANRYNRAHIYFDPAQAIHIAGRLTSKGHRTTPHHFTTGSDHSIAVALHQAIRHDQLALYDAPGLIDELATVKLVEATGNRYRLDHASDGHDDMAVTLAMAIHRWQLQRQTRRPDRQLGWAMAWANQDFVSASHWS